LKEEARLQKQEKMRHAGELQRKQKSSVDRSTESVAAKLMQQPDEVDAMSVLRNASNQQELKFAQRKLAATQRYAEKYEMPGKVLTGKPKFISQEASDQAKWVEERKEERKKVPKNDVTHVLDGEAVADLEVECRICNELFSWHVLQSADGCCEQCSACMEAMTNSGSHMQTTDLQVEPALDIMAEHEEEALAADLLVECAACCTPAPWSVLASGDGRCPGCCPASEGYIGQPAERASSSEDPAVFCVDKLGEALVEAPQAEARARWQQRSRLL